MSQVFSADSVNMAATTTLTTTTETVLATGNFLNPPFQNAKAVVVGSATVTTGAGTTALALRIYRNRNAENVLVANTGAIQVSAAVSVGFAVTGADVIPDGRPVQYTLAAQQLSATGNGSAPFGNVSVLLISG